MNSALHAPTQAGEEHGPAFSASEPPILTVLFTSRMACLVVPLLASRASFWLAACWLPEW